FLLNGQHVRHLSIEAVTPELRTVRNSDQVCLYHQGVALLEDSARDDGIDAELVSSAYRIDVLALVAEDRGARHHAQRRQLRERIDDALGDPVRQILGVLVA